jgi:hypothetical protein
MWANVELGKHAQGMSLGRGYFRNLLDPTPVILRRLAVSA